MASIDSDSDEYQSTSSTPPPLASLYQPGNKQPTFASPIRDRFESKFYTETKHSNLSIDDNKEWLDITVTLPKPADGLGEIDMDALMKQIGAAISESYPIHNLKPTHFNNQTTRLDQLIMHSLSLVCKSHLLHYE